MAETITAVSTEPVSPPRLIKAKRSHLRGRLRLVFN
jgi:hypothetical protein